jgi:hypothetical protein
MFDRDLTNALSRGGEGDLLLSVLGGELDGRQINSIAITTSLNPCSMDAEAIASVKSLITGKEKAAEEAFKSKETKDQGHAK